MAQNRKYYKTNKTRPRKSPGARRRRQLEHRKRLVSLGVDPSTVESLNTKEVRGLLKYPAKVKATLATSE